MSKLPPPSKCAERVLSTIVSVSPASLISRLPIPTFGVQKALAVLTVIAQCGIAVTGTIVRVSQSGLGCPKWPQCASGSLVPIADPVLGQTHQWIEFGNRLLTFGVTAVSILMFLAALLSTPRRRRYVLLALTMPLGVVLQAVVGGMTVLLQLQWWSVCVHFLVSPLLIWLSVLVLRAVDEGDEPAHPVVRGPARGLLVAQSVLIVAVLVAGTFVTAAGPHAGDYRSPRLDIPIPTLTAIHGGLVVALVLVLSGIGVLIRTQLSENRVLRARYRALVAVVLANGAIGITQYLLKVPETMVPFHVLGAVLVTAGGASMWCAARDRGPRPLTHVDAIPDVLETV